MGFSTSVKCKVCMCEHRNLIEKWHTVDRLTYKEIILKCREEFDFKISERALSNHFSKHFNTVETGMDEYYKERMLSFREGVDRMKSDLEYLDSVIEAGSKRFHEARITDALRAIELKHKLTGGKNFKVMIDSEEKFNDIAEAISILPEESKRMILDFLDKRQREREEQERKKLGIEEDASDMTITTIDY